MDTRTKLLGSRPKMTFCLQWTLLIDWFTISIALWFDIVTHVSFFIFSAKGTAGSYIWFVPLHCSFLPRSYVIPPSFSRRSYVLPYAHWFFFTLRWDTHMIQTVVHSPLHVRHVTHGTLLTHTALRVLKKTLILHHLCGHDTTSPVILCAKIERKKYENSDSFLVCFLPPGNSKIRYRNYFLSELLQCQSVMFSFSNFLNFSPKFDFL